jgi:hypothetical protein
MSDLRLKQLILFILIATSAKVNAQIAISGTVKDSSGKALSSVSVTLKKNNGIVLAFAISNAAGAYKLQNANLNIKDTLYVEANSIGYAKQKVLVTAATQVVDFTMHSSSVRLPNVTVTNNNLLRKEGDTLNYNVAAFSNKGDRTIGDVIKKLPGVEVDNNGQISYGGKPINRFYIDGDNLLDGRYNIATKGIPNDMVSKVQVLENHQPINALKDQVKSESAAMNLVLKDKARIKIMGTGDLALGTPDVYNGTVNTMLFKKQVKFINYIKTNNAGVDLSDETFNHFGGENDQPVSIVNAGASNPDLLKKRYLFNNAGLINVNDMINLKNNYQLRINAFYLGDRQYQSNQYSSAYFLPNDTIRYAEKQDAKTLKNTFNTQFTLTANQKNYFLNNVTVIENSPRQVFTGLQATSNNNIVQHLDESITKIVNRFTIIKKYTNGQVFEANSTISNISNPVTLQVEPGLYASQFNNNIAYAGLIQEAAVPSFHTENNVSFSKIWPRFQMHYKIGVDYQAQQLNSMLESKQLSGSISSVADSFINRLNWNRLRSYIQAEYTYNKEPITITGTIPFSYQNTEYTGRLVNNRLNTPLFTPRVYVRYTTGKESFFSLSYNYGDTYGGISQVYDGYVMRGYRDFFSNGTLLNETKSHSFSGTYILKNTLKIFFFAIGGGFNTNTLNTMSDLRLSSLLQQSKLIPYENVSTSTSLFSSISKYLFPLQTTIGARVSWQRSIGNQLQNGDLLQTQTDSYSYNVSINTRFSSFFNLGYTGIYTTFGSKPIGDKGVTGPASPKVNRWQHELAANFTISNNFIFKLSGDQYRYQIPGSQDNQYTFADAYFTYKLNKLKTDIELSMTNLAGIDSYSTASLSSNSIVESSYSIRPRMVMLKFYYRF